MVLQVTKMGVACLRGQGSVAAQRRARLWWWWGGGCCRGGGWGSLVLPKELTMKAVQGLACWVRWGKAVPKAGGGAVALRHGVRGGGVRSGQGAVGGVAGGG